MKKAVPFEDKDLDEYLERFDEEIRGYVDVYIQLTNCPNDPLLNEDGVEYSEEMKEKLAEAVKNALGI